MTGRRNIRKRIRDLDQQGTVAEWPETVEIAGVAGTPLDEDGLAVVDKTDEEAKAGDEADEKTDDSFTISVPSLAAREDGEDDGTDATPECETCGVNPAYPGLSGECEACAGMPPRDWREEVRDPDG